MEVLTGLTTDSSVEPCEVEDGLHLAFDMSFRWVAIHRCLCQVARTFSICQDREFMTFVCIPKSRTPMSCCHAARTFLSRASLRRLYPQRVIRRMLYRRRHGRVPRACRTYNPNPYDSTVIIRCVMEADNFIDDTAGGPVVVYLEVCVLEVQLLMSPDAGDGIADCAHLGPAPLVVDLHILWRTNSNPL